MIALVSTFAYFFFTFQQKKEGVVTHTANVGRFVMMGCFGAYFGSTIMARMALLVERLQFFLDSWIPAIRMLF